MRSRFALILLFFDNEKDKWTKPLCLATLTLLIQEKNLHFLLGTKLYFWQSMVNDPVSYQSFCYLTIMDDHKKITEVCFPIMTAKHMPVI